MHIARSTAQLAQHLKLAASTNGGAQKEDDKSKRPSPSRYETPWIIVFDRMHWEFRDSELRRFRNELEKQGRPVCMLVVTGPIRGMSYFDTSVFKQISELNHTLNSRGSAPTWTATKPVPARVRQGTSRLAMETLLRGSYGPLLGKRVRVILGYISSSEFKVNTIYLESIQQWMYRTFMEKTKDGVIRDAILEIAAMSSEHLPLPVGLATGIARGNGPSHICWKITDRDLAALGLIRIAMKAATNIGRSCMIY